MSVYEVPIDGRCEYIDSIDSDMSLPTNTFLVKSLGRKRDESSHLVVLCAEPGVGKTHAMNALLQSERQRGAFTRVLDFSSAGEDETPARLSRSAREVHALRERYARVAVGIDGLTAGDESAVARETRAIRKMLDDGCTVILCIRSESAALVEQLRDRAVVAGCFELTARGWYGNDPISRLTHGIPALYVAATSDARQGIQAFEDDSAYVRALREQIVLALRETLADEEVELRLALMLLGKGTQGDLAELLDRLDADELFLMESTVPLLGVTSHGGRFGVAGLCEIEGLRATLSSIEPVAQNYTKLVVRSARVLAQRGEYRRSALVCGLCHDVPELYEMGCESGFQYVVAGAPSLVARSIGYLKERGHGRETYVLLAQQALDEVFARRSVLEKGREACVSARGLSNAEYDAQRMDMILSSCRDGLDAIGGDDRTVDASGRDIATALRLHAVAQAALFSGRFSKAFNLLVDLPARRNPGTFAAALLSMDFSVAETLMGEVPVSQERVDRERAQSIMRELGDSRIDVYRNALSATTAILMGRESDFPCAEVAIAKSEEYGDGLLTAVFLLAAAIADLRNSAMARAHVRANRALGYATCRSADYLAHAARLVMSVIDIRLGGEITPEQEMACEGQLGDVLRILASASRGETHVPVRLDHLSRFNCSRDVLWAVNLVLNDTGDLASEVHGLIPEGWRGLVSTALAQFEDGAQAVEAHPQALSRSRGADGVKPSPAVRVSILGNFEVWVGKRRIPAERLVRRHVREVIGMLALAVGHRVSRRDLIASIWGEIDYVSGLKRLYESICACRKALGSRELGTNPIISNKIEGIVSLDPAIVSCDVDDLERSARDALAVEGNDRDMVRLGCRACTMYGGGVDFHPMDATGLADARTDALRSLYVDVASATAAAALREGRPRLAARLAREAYDVQPAREDVTVCLIEGLAAIGRLGEVVALYEDYRRRLPQLGLRRPAAGVAKAVEDALTRMEGRGEDMDGPAAIEA
ncbi:AfsR/SARP family transcriptional regulator [Olsenella uli]